ncbi:hypothetical protein RclHR1_14780004 [Rhizophagus clarus]|uniref:Uncharacterized protein n=1 Tax=Rhizophagus clarus TaxID=94130 RepID=A0A2Z6QDI6_9GLOM|nr:hypothetical protein RclHR1_14780004 [Rhizophagus clarus]
MAKQWTKFELFIMKSAHCFTSLINAFNYNLQISNTNPSKTSDAINKGWDDIQTLIMSAALHTLSLRKKKTLHLRLEYKHKNSKTSDLKRLDKHTTIILVFVHEIL